MCRVYFSKMACLHLYYIFSFRALHLPSLRSCPPHYILVLTNNFLDTHIFFKIQTSDCEFCGNFLEFSHMPTGLQENPGPQARYSAHLTVDQEEVDISDLEEDAEAQSDKFTGHSGNIASAPMASQNCLQSSSHQEPFICRMEQQPTSTSLPLPLPSSSPHIDWFHQSNAQTAAAISSDSEAYQFSSPLPPSMPPPPYPLHLHHPQHPPHQGAQPFLGLRGLGLSPLFLQRHPHLPHGSHSGMHDPNKRHTWTGEEDRRLKELVRTVGPRKWGIISTHFKNRNAKQCHQRWHYVLKPSITREPWTEEEDNAIMQYQIQIGNKWSQIAKFLHGRTGYAIRNRYNFLSKRQLEEAQRHFRPFLGPPLSLHMYAAAAAASAEGRSSRTIEQEMDVGTQHNAGHISQNGDIMNLSRKVDEENADSEDGEEEKEIQPRRPEVNSEEVNAGTERQCHLRTSPSDGDHGERDGAECPAENQEESDRPDTSANMLLEPLPVPRSWARSSAVAAPQDPYVDSVSPPSMADSQPNAYPTNDLVAPPFPLDNTPFPPLPNSHALHGTCKTGPAAAAGLSTLLSTMTSKQGDGTDACNSESAGRHGEIGNEKGGRGASPAFLHEQLYHARHGSASSFENAVFANLELMATAAGQQQQVPVTSMPANMFPAVESLEQNGKCGIGKAGKGRSQQVDIGVMNPTQYATMHKE